MFSRIIHIMSCHVISYLVLIFKIHDIVIMIIIRYMKPSTSTNNPSLYILNYSRPSTWNQQLIDSVFWQTVTHPVPILLSNPCSQIKQDAQYVSYEDCTLKVIRLYRLSLDIQKLKDLCWKLTWLIKKIKGSYVNFNNLFVSFVLTFYNFC